MRWMLLFPVLFLSSCFLWGSAEEQPPVFQKDRPSIPAMTIIYPASHKLYSGRLKSRSAQTSPFSDGPTFDRIQRVAVEDYYSCVESIKDGAFVLKDQCAPFERQRLENVTDAKVLPSNDLKLIGAYEVKSKRPLTRASFICFMILETMEQTQLVALSFDRTPDLKVEATGETTTLTSATGYWQSLYCPHHDLPVTWKPKL